MHSDSGRNDSIWMATAPLETPPRLPGHLTADVAVIGAGLAGLTTAYLLAAEGRGVVVLDDGPIGGQQDDFAAPFARLEAWARERFPIEKAPPLRWSGQVLEPVDSLAFIGHNPTRGKNVFIATGDSGNGLTHATIAGLLLTDLIQGRHSPWQELYDPARRSLRAAKDFGRENLNVAAQFADWVKPGDVKAARYLKRGHGAVFREGLRKIAAFRDDDGTLYQHSAVCPHLGCVVAWNDAERTWDCPCHGSRFDKHDGHPLNGPAVAPLGAPREPSRRGSGRAGRSGRVAGRA